MRRDRTPETETRRVDSPTGEQLYAVTAGSGETAVVLVHGSGTTGVCAWAADIGWLADAGHRVIGYDAACVGNSTCDADGPHPCEDLASVVAAARDDGAERVVVLAASAGGPMAPQIAAVPDTGVDAAVALSPADLSLEVPGSDLTTADAAAAATVPLLYVLAEGDPYAEPADVRPLAEPRRPPSCSCRGAPGMPRSCSPPSRAGRPRSVVRSWSSWPDADRHSWW